jgi:MFS superfamily sulfate permease-like transporter
VTLLFSGVLIAILLIFKEWAEPLIKKRSSFPIPIDLLVIIISTAISWIFQINEKFQVVVVGNVPTGYTIIAQNIVSIQI